MLRFKSNLKMDQSAHYLTRIAIIGALHLSNMRQVSYSLGAEESEFTRTHTGRNLIAIGRDVTTRAV